MQTTLEVTVLLETALTPEALWRAWTDPAILPLWLAPPPYDMVAAEVATRPGGVYRHDIVGPDGTHSVVGTFLHFEPTRHLRKSWRYSGPNPAPRVEPTFVDITIERNESGKTLLTLVHSGLRDERERAHYGDGWPECFKRLEALNTNT